MYSKHYTTKIATPKLSSTDNIKEADRLFKILKDADFQITFIKTLNNITHDIIYLEGFMSTIINMEI